LKYTYPAQVFPLSYPFDIAGQSIISPFLLSRYLGAIELTFFSSFFFETTRLIRAFGFGEKTFFPFLF